MATKTPSKLQSDHPTAQILRRCWSRLNELNEHWMHCIVGREGSGKSLTAIRLGNLMDESFTAGQVFFHPAELLRRLRDEEYQQGDVYVLDEAGVGLGRRTWQESGQKRLNQALQLIRNHNVGLIFTLPRLSELDSQAQGRLHSYHEIKTKEPDEWVAGPWHWMDPDRADITGKVYRKKPRVDGAQVLTVRLQPPTDDELVANYEARKGEFQQEFYDEAIEALGDGDGDEEEDSLDSAPEIAADIRDDGGAEQYIREYNNGAQVVLDKDAIAVDYSVGDRVAKKVKKALLPDVDREGVI
jgi:hypothetical protein